MCNGNSGATVDDESSLDRTGMRKFYGVMSVGKFDGGRSYTVVVR